MITFQYFLSQKNHRPPMSKALRAVLTKAANGHKWHIVDEGTVGDDRHRLENPDSKHLHNPPDAIDIRKVYQDDELLYNCVNLSNRQALAKRIRAAGGKVAHAADKKKSHLHVEVS